MNGVFILIKKLCNWFNNGITIGLSRTMNSVASWKDHELQHHENPSSKFMVFSMSLKGHEKQPKIFMMFSWVFHGFAQNLRVFMGHENWKINLAFNGFFNGFFMFFTGWHAMKNLIRFPMKIPLKCFENQFSSLFPR